MIPKGDNFETVYAGGTWIGQDPPGIVLAMILIGWINPQPQTPTNDQ